ncbi:MAG: hypothetical protein P0Y53_08790 [Candidatus Pseudobacter hemicellulosilyticus]|uniref:Uncharacterized protein n=1 Tax=Candidatus Pseudobacter hemicellulosilyticus TaxID=3121375 RepID=A0AAJ6BIS7_9BACT|nr:MAG: hypothetical protein P0Y53_08790 [Pseudobacter sp.]
MEKQLNGLIHDHILQHLEQISAYIETELADKQETIRTQTKRIEELKLIIHQKEGQITTYLNELKDIQEGTEGNRQLINKLLGNISNLQNEIDWYKRTYETRSFLGTIKEKLRKK